MNPILCSECKTKNSEFDLNCAGCGRALPLDSVWEPVLSSSPNAVPHSPAIVTPLADPQAPAGNPSRDKGIESSAAWPAEGDIEQLEVGTRLEHFEIIERVGCNAGGELFKARDLQLDRFVALKLVRITEEEADGDRDWLVREAKLASTLNHPNIVTIYDIGQKGDRHFIVMEWFDGTGLQDLIPASGMPWPTVLSYGLALAEGLSKAHQQGVLHGCINLDRIMVSGSGQIKILGFGMGRSHRGRKGVARQPKVFDPQPDIQSLGEVLHQMIAGSPSPGQEAQPRLGDSDWLEVSVQEPGIGADAPGELVGFIDDCRARDSRDRPQTMAEIARRLEFLVRRYLPTKGAGEVDSIYETAEPQSRWRAFQWPVLGFAAVLALVLLLYGTGLVQLRTVAPSVSSLPEGQIKLAVLPFTNISGDPLLNILCDGFTREFSQKLQYRARRTADIWVIPSDHGARGEHLSSTSLLNQYGANLIISGSIRNLGNTFAITLNLIESATSRQIATHTFQLGTAELVQAQAHTDAALSELLGWPLPVDSDPVRAGGTANGEAYTHYLNGLGYLTRADRAGFLDRAVEELIAALAIDPDFYGAQRELAESYRQLWRQTGALQWYERALDVARGARPPGASDIETLVFQADLMRELGDYAAAERVLEKARKSAPDANSLLLGLARLYRETGHEAEAASLFERILALESNSWHAHVEAASFFSASGQFERALAVYRSAVDLAPRNSYPYLRIGALLKLIGEGDEATVVLERAWDLAKVSGDPITASQALLLDTKLDPAIAMLNNLTAENSADDRGWSLLGDGLRMAGRSEQAQTAYGRAIALVRERLTNQPGDSGLLMLLALYLAKAGEEEEAKRILVRQGSFQRAAHLIRAAAIMELGGDREKALDYFKSALRKGFPLADAMVDPVMASLVSQSRPLLWPHPK